MAILKQGVLPGALVFACWAGGLGSLVVTGRGQLFLRPEFMWLLGLGSLIAFGFLLAALRYPVRLPLIRLAILVVPLLHIAASDPGSMSAGMMEKRFLGVQSTLPEILSNTFTAVEPSRTTEPAGGGQTLPPSEKDRVSDDEISRAFSGAEENFPVRVEPELTIIQLLRNADRYAGKSVTLLGLLHRAPELSQQYGPRCNALLYRFLVTCCAADALPLTVVLDGDVPSVEPDQWVEVHGIFSVEKVVGKSVPRLAVAEVREVAAPANPFLF